MRYSLTSRLNVCILFAFASQLLFLPAISQTLIVDATKRVATVQPTMWGVFFEDINFGADGGLYAELVKNRSFEFFKPLMGWTVKQKSEGDILVLNRKEEATTNPVHPIYPGKSPRCAQHPCKGTRRAGGGT